MFSYRRALLDKDLADSSYFFQGITIDIGGGRERGAFKLPDNVTRIILDINAELEPDVIASVEKLPLKKCSVDSVKCTELLEHTEFPELAIRQISDILKPGGILILSTPFNIGIHGDPYDFYRFTEDKLSRMLADEFKILVVRQQGLFFTVLASMIKTAVINANSRFARIFFRPLISFLDGVVLLDNLGFVRKSRVLSSYTTGYLVVAMKLHTEAGR